MVVELQDSQYESLKKSADDNRTLLHLVKWIVLLILFFTAMNVYGCHKLDMIKEKEKAEMSVQIRQMESEGLEWDEYIDWLKASNRGW